MDSASRDRQLAADADQRRWCPRAAQNRRWRSGQRSAGRRRSVFIARSDAGQLHDSRTEHHGSALSLGCLRRMLTRCDVSIGPELLVSTDILSGHRLCPRLPAASKCCSGFTTTLPVMSRSGRWWSRRAARTGNADARALLRAAYARCRNRNHRESTAMETDHRSQRCLSKRSAQRPKIRAQTAVRHRIATATVYRMKRISARRFPSGRRPDPNKLGCPIPDRDGDGVLDAGSVPYRSPGQRSRSETARLSDKDSDADGVVDSKDQCPQKPKGDHPDPGKLGCPDSDTDGDGVMTRWISARKFRQAVIPIRPSPAAHCRPRRRQHRRCGRCVPNQTGRARSQSEKKWLPRPGPKSVAD